MTCDSRRITLISRDPSRPDRDWDCSPDAESRLILLDSFTILRYTIASRLRDLELDVERVVLDRSSSPADYLTMLASIPRTFTGDLLHIQDSENGYLSAVGRGGQRVLYSVTPEEVRSYLVTHGLVTGKEATERVAAMPVVTKRSRLRAVV